MAAEGTKQTPLFAGWSSALCILQGWWCLRHHRCSSLPRTCTCLHNSVDCLKPQLVGRKEGAHSWLNQACKNSRGWKANPQQSQEGRRENGREDDQREQCPKALTSLQSISRLSPVASTVAVECTPHLGTAEPLNVILTYSFPKEQEGSS